MDLESAKGFQEKQRQIVLAQLDYERELAEYIPEVTPESEAKTTDERFGNLVARFLEIKRKRDPSFDVASLKPAEDTSNVSVIVYAGEGLFLTLNAVYTHVDHEDTSLGYFSSIGATWQTEVDEESLKIKVYNRPETDVITENVRAVDMNTKIRAGKLERDASYADYEEFVLRQLSMLEESFDAAEALTRG